MPLCRKDRRDPSKERWYSCIDEHKMSNDEYIGCGVARESFRFPSHLKKYKKADASDTNSPNKKRKLSED